MRARLLIGAVALFATGCSCNQDYSFPKAEPPPQWDPPSDHGSWLSMDTSPEGARLTMAYYDRDRGALGYAVGVLQADGRFSWAHEQVDGYNDENGIDTGDRGKYASQKTAPDGTVWVAYQDIKAGSLRVAHRLGAAVWEETLEVDAGDGAAGTWASLAIGLDGQPYVAHTDGPNVRVSRYDGGAWSTTTVYTSADYETVDAEGLPLTIPAGAGYTRAYTTEGSEYIAFYDAASGDLHLLEGTGGGFQDSVVDADGDVGQWPSLLEHNGELSIAYQNVGDQELMLATRGGGGWQTEVVDDGAFRGADTELFLMGGELAVVYFDGRENDMLLARKGGGAWAVEQLAGKGTAAGFHNEVAVAGGKLYAACYDFTNTDMVLVELEE